MKKIIYTLLIGLFLFAGMTTFVSATENEDIFFFELSVDGTQERVVKTGDIITVVLKLKNTDSVKPYMMYAMQDEIRYDGTFLELVENSEMLSDGIETTDIAMVDRYREFYMNYLSMSGGSEWDAETIIGSFQLKVIGTAGVTKITNQDYLVSLKDGSGSYSCDANELTIILSTDCVVEFMTNGGTEIKDQTVQYGEKIERPKDPKRKGYRLEGWYTDINLTDEWDFDNDVVQSNMSLYAKWVEDDGINCWIYLWIILLLFILILLFSKKKKENEQQA